MPKYFEKSERVSHTISESDSLRNIPRNTHRRPNAQRPSPIGGKGLRRCASCAGGRGRR